MLDRMKDLAALLMGLGYGELHTSFGRRSHDQERNYDRDCRHRDDDRPLRESLHKKSRRRKMSAATKRIAAAYMMA